MVARSVWTNPADGHPENNDVADTVGWRRYKIIRQCYTEYEIQHLLICSDVVEAFFRGQVVRTFRVARRAEAAEMQGKAVSSLAEARQESKC